MIKDLRVKLHEGLHLCFGVFSAESRVNETYLGFAAGVQLIPPVGEGLVFQPPRSQQQGRQCTYALGHHFRAIVCALEHRGANDINTLDRWKRCFVFLHLRVRTHVEDLPDAQSANSRLAYIETMPGPRSTSFIGIRSSEELNGYSELGHYLRQ